MELRQLRYFVRIVELSSFSKAAQDLFIAQPALSNQISNLEKELDTQLLSRSVRGVTPTEAGKTLYRHAQAIIRQVEHLKYEVKNESANPKGAVSIGLPTSVSNVLASPLIAATQERYPEIKLQIVESLSGHLQELVSNGRIEMSLLFDNPLVEGQSVDQSSGFSLIKTPILEEELFLQTTAALSKKKTITLAAAADLNFVLPGKSNATRQLIDLAFANAGIQPKIVTELDSLSTIQAVVEDGLGATILSLSAFIGNPKDRKSRAYSIQNAGFKRTVSLCTSNTVALSIAAKCIAHMVPEIAHQLVKTGRWSGSKVIPLSEGPQ
jgi:LysR family transcriptional regulator, nitrogen assimilation regulatory protein